MLENWTVKRLEEGVVRVENSKSSVLQNFKYHERKKKKNVCNIIDDPSEVWLVSY